MTVPAKPGLWLDQKDGVPPMANETCRKDHEPALVRLEARARNCRRVSRSASRGDDELLAQKRVLGDELLTRPERILHDSDEDRRWKRCSTSSGVQSSPHAGDNVSSPSSKRGQHPTIVAIQENRSSLVRHALLRDHAADANCSQHRCISCGSTTITSSCALSLPDPRKPSAMPLLSPSGVRSRRLIENSIWMNCKDSPANTGFLFVQGVKPSRGDLVWVFEHHAEWLLQREPHCHKIGGDFVGWVFEYYGVGFAPRIRALSHHARR